MNDAEVEDLRAERDALRRQVDVYAKEHRLLAWLGGLIILGPSLARSIHKWLIKVSTKNPVPPKETAMLAAAVIRRVTKAGLVALLLPASLLIWQNCLIKDQNRYLRDQIEKVQQQITLQEAQGDSSRRAELLEVIYEGKEMSLRTRVEAVKAFIELEKKHQPDLIVNLRGVDLSCNSAQDCADLSSIYLNKVDFTDANFRGANLDDSVLSDSVFVGANLKGASMTRVELEGTIFRRPFSVVFSANNVISIMQQLEWLEKLGISSPDGEEIEQPYRSLFEFAISRSPIPKELRLSSSEADARLHDAIVDWNQFDTYRLSQRINRGTIFPLGVLSHKSPKEIQQLWVQYREMEKLELAILKANKDIDYIDVDPTGMTDGTLICTVIENGRSMRSLTSKERIIEACSSSD